MKPLGNFPTCLKIFVLFFFIARYILCLIFLFADSFLWKKLFILVLLKDNSSACLPICPSVCPTVCLTVCPTVCPTVRQLVQFNAYSLYLLVQYKLVV
jgi:hypothetical protein